MSLLIPDGSRGRALLDSLRLKKAAINSRQQTLQCCSLKHTQRGKQQPRCKYFRAQRGCRIKPAHRQRETGSHGNPGAWEAVAANTPENSTFLTAFHKQRKEQLMISGNYPEQEARRAASVRLLPTSFLLGDLFSLQW